MPSTSIYLEYGGDFQISPQGGLLLAVDSQVSATSTIQRLQRMLLTNPQQKDSNGTVIARGDCHEYPAYGVGLNGYVDEIFTSNTIASLKADILNQISQDSEIATIPAPVIDISFVNSNTVSVSVSLTTIYGVQISFPEIQIQPVQV